MAQVKLRIPWAERWDDVTAMVFQIEQQYDVQIEFSESVAGAEFAVFSPSQEHIDAVKAAYPQWVVNE